MSVFPVPSRRSRVSLRVRLWSLKSVYDPRQSPLPFGCLIEIFDDLSLGVCFVIALVSTRCSKCLLHSYFPTSPATPHPAPSWCLLLCERWLLLAHSTNHILRRAQARRPTTPNSPALRPFKDRSRTSTSNVLRTPGDALAQAAHRPNVGMYRRRGPSRQVRQPGRDHKAPARSPRSSPLVLTSTPCRPLDMPFVPTGRPYLSHDEVPLALMVLVLDGPGVRILTLAPAVCPEL